MHKLPDTLSFLSGAFIEPVSCVIHSSKAAKVTHGSSVAVIGSGLGVLHGALARLRGAAPVIVIGDNAKRLAIAKEMGVDVTINIKDGKDPVAEVKRLTDGRGADYVVEAVGTAEDLRAGLPDGAPGRHGGGLRHLRRRRHHHGEALRPGAGREDGRRLLRRRGHRTGPTPSR